MKIPEMVKGVSRGAFMSGFFEGIKYCQNRGKILADIAEADGLAAFERYMEALETGKDPAEVFDG